ncbi:hypothetical protein QJS04_geneDACA017796 [Acorus gramineus]|uniref:Uncharacterized protein n=1 Tax=Acorus gramineus TaxID=55184 RepID=A0AAV9BLK2_ACOGR|nr:hypothetical protein QJS04_geneDACA017796 [Acorus gramineus]
MQGKDKGHSILMLRPNPPPPWPPKFLPSLTAALFVAALLVWSIDSSTVRNIRSPPDHYLPLYKPPSLPNLTQTDTFPQQNLIHIDTPFPLQNLTHIDPSPTWINVELEPNYTSLLLSRWLAPGGEQCRDSRTKDVSIPGLEGLNSPVELSAAEVHKFTMHALDDAGLPRCLGGDYFETDLSSNTWKSRPPTMDHGNGSYTFSLQVHPDFASEDFNLTVVLLFRSFEGLKFSTSRFAFHRELLRIPIRFIRRAHSSSLPELRPCRKPDFGKDVWSGRWTRLAGNDECQISEDGRFRCLASDAICREPWCDGPLGLLESNGWVYSAHCAFRIFTPSEAWTCLDKRWLFFWGDSNHVDTVRNLLSIVLEVSDVSNVTRRFDRSFVNPKNGSQSVRITNIFNGHWNETKNYLGLDSLRNPEFRALLWRYFTDEEAVPDTMIMNTGLHDGIHYRSVRVFSAAAQYAADFWDEVFEYLRERRKLTVTPSFIYRTTIATGGYARDLAFNPNKMETYNRVMVEKLRGKEGLVSGVVDSFDMSFPWHYDNRCNDGVHYGRAPAKAKWRDGEIGHQYFVDIMLAHALLNAICDG